MNTSKGLGVDGEGFFNSGKACFEASFAACLKLFAAPTAASSYCCFHGLAVGQ